jgi:hypothetical protein
MASAMHEINYLRAMEIPMGLRYSFNMNAFHGGFR